MTALNGILLFSRIHVDALALPSMLVRSLLLFSTIHPVVTLPSIIR